MVQASRRTGFTGSPLVRLLSRLTDSDVGQPRQTTAERLSQWFGWTDDISLSAALNAGPASSLSSAKASASAEEAEFARVRAALTKAIASDSAAPADATDFAPLRQRYLARQQAMEVAIGPLRSRLRTTLAGRSQAMAKLAAVDVVMEQVLAAQERSLMSSVPSLLEKRFKRLRQAALEAQAEQSEQTDQTEHPGSAPRPAPAWQDVFHKDLQDVLLAELDFRFQPVEGLLEALRMKQPG